MKSTPLAKAIARLSLTKKAGDVVLMDLREVTSMVDYFVVCSADSEVQIRAIADAVLEGMEKKGVPAWHTESGSSNWVLLDYVDVVLHIFHRNTRSFYNLEKLWGDAHMQRIGDTARSPRTPPARTARPVRIGGRRKKTIKAS